MRTREIWTKRPDIVRAEAQASLKGTAIRMTPEEAREIVAGALKFKLIGWGVLGHPPRLFNPHVNDPYT